MSEINTEVNVEYRKLSELTLWASNPRAIKKDAFERLKAQIVKLGVYKPLLVDQNNTVIGGNMRMRALQELGVERVSVIVRHVKDDAERIELALSDNDRAGYYDNEALAELVLSEDIDQELFSIDTGEAQPLTDIIEELSPSEEVEEDQPPEVDTVNPPVSQLGGVYQLGKHRVMCGSATSEDDTNKLLQAQQIDLYLTDPPYNVDYTGKTKDALKIENDKMDDGEFLAFLADAYRRADEHMKAGAAFYIFHADSEGFNFRAAVKEVGWMMKQCLIWVKQSMVMGRQDYQWKHEPILYGWKSGSSHSWYSDRKQTTVLEFDRPSRSEEHPTMKPLNILTYLIKNSSKAGDLVFDNFLGSGSTLIAAEQNGRICYGLEVDPRYVDVIRKRYQMQMNDGNEDGWEEATPAVEK